MEIIDVTGIIKFKTFSGIPRVAQEYSRALMNMGAIPAIFSDGSYYLLKSGFSEEHLFSNAYRKKSPFFMFWLNKLRKFRDRKTVLRLFRIFDAYQARLLRGKKILGEFRVYLPTLPRDEHIISLIRMPQQKVVFVYDVIPFKNIEFFLGYSSARLSLIQEFWASSDSLICNSDSVRMDLENLLNLDSGKIEAQKPNIAVIPLTNFLQKNTPLNSQRENRKFLLFVSNLEPRKNHNIFLDVLEALWAEKKFLGVKMVCGDSWLSSDLAKRIQDLMQRGFDLELHYGLTDDSLINLYEGCHATLYLSREEGFGLPIVESLAFGKPVLILDKHPMKQFANFPGVVTFDGTFSNLKRKILDIWDSDPPSKSEITNNLPLIFQDIDEWRKNFESKLREMRIT